MTKTSCFFIYGNGYNPKDMTLGSFVLRSYKNPEVYPSYIHPLMKDEELRENCSIEMLSTLYKHSPDGTFNFEGTVTAAGGERIVLNNPQKFFDQHVLTNQQARLTLSTWLSAAESRKYQLSKDFEKPRIWLLTGLYKLTEDNPNQPEPLVWAGRFQMLDLQGAGQCTWGTTLPRSIPLSRIGTGIPDGGDDGHTQPVEFVCVHEPRTDYHLLKDGLYTAPLPETHVRERDTFVEDIDPIPDQNLTHYADDREYYNELVSAIDQLKTEWRNDRQVYKRLLQDGELYRKLISENYEGTLVQYGDYLKKKDEVKQLVMEG